MIREFGDRIYFAHLRNVKVIDKHFNETAHESNTGSLDMYEIVKALQDVGFDGYIRPDHGRMIWGEVARPATVFMTEHSASLISTDFGKL